MAGGMGLAAAGLGISLLGKVFEGVGNFRQSRREEDETRRAATESQELLDRSVALREERMRSDFANTRRDIRLQQGRASGTNLARAGAMGLSGGSVGAVSDEIARTANQAVADARTQLDFGMEGIDIERVGQQYEINRGRRAADEMRTNRRWQLAADTTDFFATGLMGAAKMSALGS